MNRVVEGLIINVSQINSRAVNRARGPCYGNGRCSADLSLFDDDRSVIKDVAEDLVCIIEDAVKSDIYVEDYVFNVLGACGSTKAAQSYDCATRRA